MALNKAQRLELLKQIAQRHEDREGIAFTGFAATAADVTEEASSMDAFREHSRDAEAILTSDQA